MTEEKSLRRRFVEWVWKVVVWLKTRRSAHGVARAIASNQVAVAALATSVAAAGVGGYATINARQAESQAAHLAANQAVLAARMDRVETGLTGLQTDVAATRAAVTKLDTKDTKAVAALSRQFDGLAVSLADIGLRIDNLPPAPDIVPLSRRVAVLADATSSAARKAQEALAKAGDPKDPVARATASAASSAATHAELAATEAAVKADAAAARALTPGPKGDPGDAAAHAYRIPDAHVLADVPAVTIGTFHADLPAGQYQARLDLDGATVAYDYYVDAAGLHIHGTFSDMAAHHELVTGILDITGPTSFDVVASATGGDFADLSKITLTLTRIAP